MIEGRARATATHIASATRFKIAPQLAGRFQLYNALNAVATAQILQSKGFRVSGSDIEQGIAAATWPGRIEKVQANPDIYLDGAHNPAAARELAAFLDENFANRKLILIFGALRDKAVDEIAGILFPRATEVIFTEPRTPRSISAAQLAEIAGHHASHFEIIPDAEKALAAVLAKTKPQDAIFVTGSLYLVGQLRPRWLPRSQAVG
jgi:Folylpolyglutamate synthase